MLSLLPEVGFSWLFVIPGVQSLAQMMASEMMAELGQSKEVAAYYRGTTR